MGSSSAAIRRRFSLACWRRVLSFEFRGRLFGEEGCAFLKLLLEVTLGWLLESERGGGRANEDLGVGSSGSSSSSSLGAKVGEAALSCAAVDRGRGVACMRESELMDGGDLALIRFGMLDLAIPGPSSSLVRSTTVPLFLRCEVLSRGLL